jgi:hypothetical protein
MIICFHDVDMLPSPSLAPQYLRAMPRDEEEEGSDGIDRDKGGAVRVLSAGGCRYDADGCFGGVTLYDRRALDNTNGYPNGFWGWGGEDNAQFARCARAGVLLERVRGCDFEDTEGAEARSVISRRSPRDRVGAARAVP